MSFCSTTSPFLFQHLESLGLTPFRKACLTQLSLKTFWDVLCYLPKHYDIYKNTSLMDLEGAKANIGITVQGISSSTTLHRVHGKSFLGEEVMALFFQKPRYISKGSVMLLCGAISEVKAGVYTFIHPTLLPFKAPPPPQRVQPIYTLPKGLGQRIFSLWIEKIFSLWPKNWNTSLSQLLQSSFRAAHFPSCIEDTLPSAVWRKTLALEERIAYTLAIGLYQRSTQSVTLAFPPSESSLQQEKILLDRAKICLTRCQQEAWKRIQESLDKTTPMHHFLNGDVGSGKTIIAFLAVLRVVSEGAQACLLAPTTSLAAQHFKTFQQFAPHISSILVTSDHAFDASKRDVAVMIGTHALFYDKVVFSNLRLVVIDEQQRFGVLQRSLLIAKGHHPHVLFLSATPIPRTFEKLLLGEMDISHLQERPYPKNIQSYILSVDKLGDLICWMRGRLQAKERIYWVCPTIGEVSDKQKDVEGKETKQGVKTRYAFFQQYFPGEVALLYGDLSQLEKEACLEGFRNGTTPLLVSTTVIEVGIHVAEASTMIIEDSPSFGLSQLHQLRGRVGRGTIPGHCFFLYTPPLHKEAIERLDCLRNNQDGFYIAKKDWELRGGGEAMGTQQSGFSKGRFFSIEVHEHLLGSIKALAKDRDPHHAENILMMKAFGFLPETVASAG